MYGTVLIPYSVLLFLFFKTKLQHMFVRPSLPNFICCYVKVRELQCGDDIEKLIYTGYPNELCAFTMEV